MFCFETSAVYIFSMFVMFVDFTREPLYGNTGSLILLLQHIIVHCKILDDLPVHIYLILIIEGKKAT